jgi:hypothetical protein
MFHMDGRNMPYPENALKRRGRQIFTEPAKIEIDPVDGWLAGFFERLARLLRKMGAKK